MSKMLLRDLIDKYYTELDDIVNDLAQKCTGGEEVSVMFPNGRVTIKLK
jgi:hypothetical protein